MTPQTRQEILNLVEALCEERADQRALSRLQQLVLSDPECRRLYIEAIELHGMLYWDAAGQGSLDEMPVRVDAVPSQQSWISRKNVQRGIWSAVVSLALIVALMVIFRPSGDVINQPVAHHPHSEDVDVHSSETGSGERSLIQNESDSSFSDLPSIPGIRLTPSQAADSLVKSSQPSVAESHADSDEATILVNADNDVNVIRFINQQLAQTWEDYEVRPAPAATEEQWLRRVYLDLAGRIPTTEEIEAFSHNSHPLKREQQVDSLLSQAEFSRQMGTVWTNLLVGRSSKGKIDRPKLMSWMEEQFRKNRPWKETVTDLVTARGDAHSNGPANFLLAHLNNEAVPATAITARILLCEQLQCTQCHKHPTVKEWGQERFWQFNAFFQQLEIERTSTTEQGTGKKIVTNSLVDKEEFGPTYYETLDGFMQVAYPKFAEVEFLNDPETPLRDQFANLLFSNDQPQLARAFVNRTWDQFLGRGFTSPVDDMGPHNPVSHPELLTGLTSAFVQSDYDTKRLVRWICLSDVYSLSSEVTAGNEIDSPETGERPLFSRLYSRPLTAEQLYNSLKIASGVPPAQLYSASVSQNRDQWLDQFFTAVETEENGETTTLDGTLPQVLMMMNGELVEEATDPEKGKLLSQIMNSQNLSEVEKIRNLYLAALSRSPSPAEMSRIRQTFRQLIRQRIARQTPPQVAISEGYRDLYWAFLNSSDFVVNQ